MLLGLDVMQIKTAREMRAAYYVAVGLQQLNSLVEQVGLINESNDAYLQKILIDWNQQNSRVLPAGRGRLMMAKPGYVASVFWGDSQRDTCEDNIIGVSGCLSMRIG